MRVFYGLALVLAATGVSGCVSNTLNGLSNLSTSCTTSATSVNCVAPTGTGTGTGTGSTGTTGTTGTTTTNTNTGNTATITTGDTTLALEANKAISTQANPAVSKLSSDPFLATPGATNTFTINTNTASNSSWPFTKTMSYYAAAGTGPVLADNAKYAEYRYFQKGVYDEELQVWSWGDAYATQYRDVTNSGTAPVHQAWSFGGNYTSQPAMAALKTGNVSATYHGSWAATAQTSNWIDSTDPLQTISFNNNWRVQGTSHIVANFGTGDINGTTLNPSTLTATNWFGVNKNGFWEDALNSNPQNVAGFMLSKVILNGNITTSTATNAHPNQVVGTANMNPADGWITTANSNPMYAGFFGPGASEIAGVFALDTAFPRPIGGNGPSTTPNDNSNAINDDRRGFLSMSGMFHGTTP